STIFLELLLNAARHGLSSTPERKVFMVWGCGHWLRDLGRMPHVFGQADDRWWLEIATGNELSAMAAESHFVGVVDYSEIASGLTDAAVSGRGVRQNLRLLRLVKPPRALGFMPTVESVFPPDTRKLAFALLPRSDRKAQ